VLRVELTIRGGTTRQQEPHVFGLNALTSHRLPARNAGVASATVEVIFAAFVGHHTVLEAVFPGLLVLFGANTVAAGAGLAGIFTVRRAGHIGFTWITDVVATENRVRTHAAVSLAADAIFIIADVLAGVIAAVRRDAIGAAVREDTLEPTGFAGPTIGCTLVVAGVPITPALGGPVVIVAADDRAAAVVLTLHGAI
jgi:hypothetical protein